MDKFKKRITKNITKPPFDCLVVGNAFGFLDEVLETFNTVFIYGNENKNLKARNLIYRQSIASTYDLRNLTAVFIDLDYISIFEELLPVMTGPGPDLFIEGNDVIPRTHTKIIYRLGYLAVNQLGWCHQWSVKR